MRRCFRLIAAAGLVAVITACAASPPPYEPAISERGPGYGDTRIEADRYRVSYTGRSSDAASIAEDLALLRAAEVTLQNGYDWFVIVNRRVTTVAETSDNPRVSFGVGTSTGSRSGTSVGLGIGFGGGGSAPQSPPQAVLEIKLGRGEKPEDGYDAVEIERNVRSSVLTATP